MFWNGRGKKIESFETVVLGITGMRQSNVYEIKQNGGEAEITEYLRVCREGGGTELVPKRTAKRSAEEVVEALNGFRLPEWNGFHGAHPRGVKDGTMFELRAEVNGGERIFAEGSQNFPKHYRELCDWFYTVLHENKE